MSAPSTPVSWRSTSRTASVAWEQKIDDWKNAYAVDRRPAGRGEKVITGIAGAEYGVRGYVRAYDATTGKPLWTTLHDPRPRRTRQRDLAGRNLEDRRRQHLADRSL